MSYNGETVDVNIVNAEQVSGGGGAVALGILNSNLTNPQGQLRIANPTTIFDAQQEYDSQPALFNDKVTGGATATHEPNYSSTTYAVFSDGDKFERQQTEYNRYQSGKVQRIKTTFTGDASATQNYEFVLRSSVTGFPTETIFTQANWNMDTLSGLSGPLNPSGLELTNNAELFVIDFLWLSVGIVQFGFYIDGRYIICHQYKHANNFRFPYMGTGNLPLRTEIESTGGEILQSIGYYDYDNGLFLRMRGSGTAAEFTVTCFEVESEGGDEQQNQYSFSTGNFDTPIVLAAGATLYLNLRHALLFNGKTNRVKFVPNRYYATSSDENIAIRLWYNPVTTGGTYFPVGGDIPSAIEASSDVTSISGGTIIEGDNIKATSGGFFTPQQQGKGTFGINNRYPYGLDMDGANPTNLVLEIKNIGAGPTDIFTRAIFGEIR